MQETEFKLHALDGLKLHGRKWTPESAPGAVVCLVHGMGEHCGRYGHVAAALTAAGYALMAMDLRGHGLSEGKRGHARSYTVLMDDLFLLLEAAEAAYPGLPVFLYGHSLGGNLVIYYALRRLPALAGIIATSPLFRTAVKPPAWKIRLLRALYNVWPGLSVSNGLETEALTRDAAALQAYRDDPLIHDRVSARLAMDMLSNGGWIMAHAEELRCPLLLMHGKADRITSSRASLEFALTVGDSCSLKLWSDGYHELHNDPRKDEVLAHMIAWLETIRSGGHRLD